MSKPMTRAAPAFAAAAAMPTIPPAGPDNNASLPLTAPASARPPEDCMNKGAPPNARSSPST